MTQRQSDYIIGQCGGVMTSIRVRYIRALYAIGLRRAAHMILLRWTIAIAAPIVAYLVAGDAVRSIADVMVAAAGGAP